MFGANIGTTMTGILASIGGSAAGKRTAALHTIINTIATIIGMILLGPYSKLILSIAGNANPMMQIAIANMVFKAISTLLFLPFVDKLVALVSRIIPEAESVSSKINVDEVDEAISLQLPSAAITASQQAILKMVDMVRLEITDTELYLRSGGKDVSQEKLKEMESIVNGFDLKITDYLIRLNTRPNLSATNSEDIRFQFDAIKNYERVGDLAMNLSEFYEMVFSKNEAFTEEAISDIGEMYKLLIDMFDFSAEIYMTRDLISYEKLKKMETKLDDMEVENRQKHFTRMSEKICTSPVAESIYSDILGTIERMGDHCCNVAKSAVTGLTSDLSDDEIIASTAL
jgi:phosphate:Na+ symporter